jgi:hypothetical protein
LTERAAKGLILSKDQEKIGALKGEFAKLVQDFNQAVNVEALRGIRLIGEYKWYDQSRRLLVTPSHFRGKVTS